MCIKTVKTRQKCEKMQGTPPWKLGEQKMEVGENGEEEECGSLHASRPNFVVPSPLAIVITKMSFCHSELQKCHSWASNVGPFTQMTWK